VTPPSGPWEREVRRFVLAALVFVFVLAGVALAALGMTTRWAVDQTRSRFVAEARAVANRLAREPDPAGALAGDGNVLRLVRGFASRQVALYDPSGRLLRTVSDLPESGRTPGTLLPDERPRAFEARVSRDEDWGVPVVSVTIALEDGRAVLRTRNDATPLAAAETTVRTLTFAVPAGLALLFVLVLPFLRRLARPLDALTRTARNAASRRPSAPAPPPGPDAAVETFARTIDELEARTAELEALRQREQERADALAVTAATLVRSHPGGLLVIGPSGILAEANGPALAALGLDREALGGPAAGRLADWDVLARAVEAALRGEPTLAAEASRGDSTGAKVLAVTAVPVADAEGRLLGALVFLEDRTAVRRLERELSFRRELASLGEMSAGIAHEFRNATAAILGYARLAGAAGDAEARGRHLARIRAEAEHVARVTGDFLLFARPERVHLAPVDLATFLEEVVSEGRATSPGVSIALQGDLPTLEADAALLRRALVNLVRNAAEAAGEEGRVLVRGERAADGAFSLTVEDSGPGIAPDALPGLFVPFSSTKEGGTGLGLSLVAKIAALHGAVVTAGRSATLGGASFRVAFPPRAPARS
jgi:signal transduction histidine kinase/HAMP domain-containing protein